MDKQFEIIRKTRQFVLTLIEGLSAEQLNEVPASFNNNIVWNLAHLLASQQGICYARGGLALVIEEELFLSYKPGTTPTGFVTAEKIGAIKQLLFSTIDQLEQDYKAGLFKNNPVWTNRYGIDHTTIEDSINFLLVHEGLHIGCIMALKKMVTK